MTSKTIYLAKELEKEEKKEYYNNSNSYSNTKYKANITKFTTLFLVIREVD
jgi:hypothetical protein